MFSVTQDIYNYFESENREIYIGELVKKFSAYHIEAIDNSLKWLVSIEFLEQSSYLEWRLTNQVKGLIKEYKDSEPQRHLQQMENLQSCVDFEVNKMVCREIVNDKWSITSAIASATLLILLLA